MSYAGPESMKPGQQYGADWRGSYSTPTRSRSSGGPPWGLMLTGLVAVGLGVLAWKYLEPDVRRYMKIKSM